MFSTQKIKVAKFFTRTDIDPSLYLLFFKYYREVVLLLKFSIQKIKEAEFFNELTIHSRFVLFASFKYYREVVLFWSSRYKK